MRFTSLFPAFVAISQVSATPDTDESYLDRLEDGEVHVFKRDAIISLRDFDLAKRHSVDPSQSTLKLVFGS